ncbi:MAG: fimbrial protein [Bacteroidales bacterium]|jgi:hypothetical protein|nr:fimbrial protein [Bacteroidales bacterium]
MKTNILIIISLFIIIASGCNKITPEPVIRQTKKATVNINISNNAYCTKGTDISQEKTISSLQVFVFRIGGSLDISGKSETSSINLSCTTGDKTIYALVNAPDLNVSTEAEFLSSYSSLSENDPEKSFIMIGSTNSSITANTTLEIDVKRISSRVVIKKIETSFTSAVYKTTPFTIKKIYLINVAADYQYSVPAPPTKWLNKMKNDNEAPSLTSETINQKIENGNSYTVPHYFYAYPNPTLEDNSDPKWTARHTRLVIEATLGDVTYYYPVTLPEMECNKSYEITNLTITRPGSANPDKPVIFYDNDFSIKITDWAKQDISDTI